MINLIPPTARRGVLVEYWIRVVSVWLILWSVALFAATSLLLPAYVFVNSQVRVYQESAELASQKVADYEAVSTALVRASQQAKTVMDEANRFQISDYVELLEQLQGDEIQINRIELGRAEQGVLPAVVGGMADNRQALASFRDRLLTDKRISAVDLPISNLAQDKNIPFTITITLANQQDTV